MNYLSHYYFDRHQSNCYKVLGTVLPDLLKNADKDIILHPAKHHYGRAAVQHIYQGWNKHLEVDRYFHNSDFFKTHSHQLKLVLRTAIEGSPVKPFFLGHIGLELILDSLLLTNRIITADDFYNHLECCEEDAIREFLSLNGVQNTDVFINFFTVFKRERYLHTYAQTNKVAYALKRICMRIWDNPFTTQQEAAITEAVKFYTFQLEPNFMQIFRNIERMLVAEQLY